MQPAAFFREAGCGPGHMGPITHPQQVNEAIADFFDRH